MTTRTPDAQVYDLGHNEQMQLGIAISALAEVVRNHLADPDYDPGLFIGDDQLALLDIETLATFEGIFNLPHGAVSIIRTDEAQ